RVSPRCRRHERGDGGAQRRARPGAAGDQMTHKDSYPRMWYGLGGPRSWVVVHNIVGRTVDMRFAVNGFRYWRSPYSKRHHAMCQCGWRPDLGKHYRMRGPRGGMKCITKEELESYRFDFFGAGSRRR